MKLKEIATVRSKNAGPFLLCFDVLFSDASTYDKVARSGAINSTLFASALGLSDRDCNLVMFDQGLAIKCTVPRTIPSGAVGDWDIYGSAQELPIADLEIDLVMTSEKGESGV